MFLWKGVLFFFFPEMSWVSVVFGQVCKLVLHIIKRKKISERENKVNENHSLTQCVFVTPIV